MADAAFENDLEDVHARAIAAGVTNVLVVGTDIPTSRRAIEVCHEVPGWLATVGVHPHDCECFDESAIASIRSIANDQVVRAIGETGLDFFREHQPRGVQEKAFRAQCRLARELELPVVVHQRDSMDQVEHVLKEELGPQGGVMHSFTGGAEAARKFVALGMHVSISGIITFKKSEAVRDMAASIPIDRLMVETDAPYLSPVPHRGRRNEPAHVLETLRVIARVRDISMASLQAVTTQNAARLFRCESGS